MSDYLGAMATRALGLSAVARPRPSLFEPRRAAPEPPVVEQEAVSAPQPLRAEEAPRARSERIRPASEIEPLKRRRQEEPGPAAETGAAAPPLPSLPAEPPAVRPGAKAESPPSDRAAATPVVREAGARRTPPPPEPAKAPPVGPIETTPAARPAQAAPEPTLAVSPSFPTLARRDAPEPTVRVTIGRIDVRAVRLVEPPEPRKKPRPEPGMSLEEYLDRTRGRTG